MRTLSGILVCGLLSLASGCRMCASPYDYLGPVDDCGTGGFAGWEDRRNSILGYGGYATEGEYVEGDYVEGDYVEGDYAAGQVLDGPVSAGEYTDDTTYDGSSGPEIYQESGPVMDGEPTPADDYYEEGTAPAPSRRHGRLQPVPDPTIR